MPDFVFQREGRDDVCVRLDRAEICLGRHPSNDVVVPDPTLPEVAAVIVDRPGRGHRLRDLTGGRVRINARAVDADELRLVDGDLITLGAFSLRFVSHPASGGSGRTAQLARARRAAAPATLTHPDGRLSLSTDRPTTIGSDPDNDLQVEEPSVSAFHCRIACEDGTWMLVDLSSTNGTEINGLRVHHAELPSPADLRIGRVGLRFEIGFRDSELDGPDERDAHGAIRFGGLWAASAAMHRVFELVRRFAPVEAPALIVGPSGAGKELVARAIHDCSPRADAPFLALNCGALSATVIESELFGHERGAFTGAERDKEGAFEAAQNGTLFLDEIGELPLELQPKLLRVLESRAVRRVGGTREIPVGCRVVAATHRNLAERVADGELREDLFHRLAVLVISVPSLGERPEDVPLLAEKLLAELAPGRRLGADALTRLAEHDWPGNVRELRNVLLRAALLSDELEIAAQDLEFADETLGLRPAATRLRDLDEDERGRIEHALRVHRGNRAEAARSLGLSKSTFHDKVRRLGLPSSFGRSG